MSCQAARTHATRSPLAQITAVVYGLVLGRPTLASLLWLALGSVAQYLVLGGLVASFTVWLCNAHLRGPAQPHTVEQKVEWMYALDVHANAFWVLFLLLHLGQLLLLPLLAGPGFSCMLLGNSLYAAALGVYVYLTFRGFLVLPFLQRPSLLLYPLVPLALGLLLSIALQVHVARGLLGWYFAL